MERIHRCAPAGHMSDFMAPHPDAALVPWSSGGISEPSSARRNVRGWLASLLLHLLFALAFLAMLKSASQVPQQPRAQLIPINIVQLDQNTTSPPQRVKASVPQQR